MKTAFENSKTDTDSTGRAIKLVRKVSNQFKALKLGKKALELTGNDQGEKRSLFSYIAVVSGTIA